MAAPDIPAQKPSFKGAVPAHIPSYEEQLATVESMMTCYDTPLTQAAGYVRDLLRTIIGLQKREIPDNAPLTVFDTMWDFLDKRIDDADHDIAASAFRWIDEKYRNPPKQEISDEGLLRAMRTAQISDPMRKPWVVTRWKDGIDIEEPTQSLRRFAAAILNGIQAGQS